MTFQGLKSGSIFGAPEVKQSIIAGGRQSQVVRRESHRAHRLIGIGGGLPGCAEFGFGFFVKIRSLFNRFLAVGHGLGGCVGRPAGQLEFRFGVGFGLFRLFEFLFSPFHSLDR